MAIIIFFSLILTLILTPIFTIGESWIIKFIFFALSFLLTPFVGIPFFLYIMKH